MAASINLFLVVFLNCLCFSFTSSNSKQPNIVFILTDDQDVVIGGETPMVKTNKLIGEAGIIFKNMFVSSPLCCPSRSSIFTGRYVHNHMTINNSLSGNCSSKAWQVGPERESFVTYLKQQGYKTFFAGKYLNQYGEKKAGGVQHVPMGWDSWAGLVGNSVYYDYSLSINGKEEKHGHDYKKDYLTDVINDRATDFLNAQDKDTDPFFMMLSTPACHAPFTPAPQYNNSFNDTKAPRNGSFNLKGKDKHWLITQAINPLPNDTIEYIDKTYRNRWRTLLSVDDMVENVHTLLNKKGLLNSTYIFFSSDNGYHLGQFSLPSDKRQLYEFDVRVPLMVSGPGIKSGQVSQEIVMNIDLAPTFLDLSSLTPPTEMDGQSIAPLLHQTHRASATERPGILIEHQGEYRQTVKGCPQYTNQGLDNCNNHCVCEDSKNNTYGCVRVIATGQNYKYCEFEDTASFIELYDLSKDSDEITNIAKTADPKVITELSKLLSYLSLCMGDQCRKGPPDGR